ncbi:MAG TPA: hypothetical protein DEQ73_00995 [Phycisphaerales bacterium]|nr:hypothetical protein [Phycisphaerales bacterium]
MLAVLALALAPAGFRFELTGELARVVHLPLVPFQWAGVKLADALRNENAVASEQEDNKQYQQALLEARRDRDIALAQSRRLQITLDALRDRMRRSGETGLELSGEARRVRADVLGRSEGFVQVQLERRCTQKQLHQSAAVMNGNLVGWVSSVGIGKEATVVNLLPITAPNAPKLLGVVRLESGQDRTVKLTPRDGELVGYLEIDNAPYAGEPVRLLPAPGIPDVAVGLALGRLFSSSPAPGDGVRLREIRVKPQDLPKVRAELLVPLKLGEAS